MNFTIEVLNKNLHDRDSFDCGIDELNNFLKLHANQNQQKNISKSYVAVPQDNINHPKTIAGYYTLSSGHITLSQLSETIQRSLPKHPVPIARIGRLAVHKTHHRQGVGGYLLHNALTNILNISQKIGIYAVVVDAKNNIAKT